MENNKHYIFTYKGQLVVITAAHDEDLHDIFTEWPQLAGADYVEVSGVKYRTGIKEYMTDKANKGE